MKLKRANGVGIETNMTETESMDFGIGDPSIIIEILRNRLYSNPIQTLVQEYISNGRDASRAAKHDIPLKITLPTKLESVFKVRDYGIGLTDKMIRDVFVLYGKSTKRGSDEQTGGFGIGAKSAWAYTDSFTVTTYVDGVASSFLAHIGENSNGKLTALGKEKTNEPNGTEIQIAVHDKDRRAFINATFRATLFWKTKPVFEGITEAEIPKFYKELNNVMTRDNWAIYKSENLNSFLDGTFSYDDSYSYNRNYNGGVVVVVDGIPYKLSNKFLELSNIAKCMTFLNNKMVLTINCGNGDVEVSASREAIADSQFSQESINKMAISVFESISKQIKEELDKAKDFRSYVNTHYKLNKTLNEKMATEKKIGKTKYEIDGRYVLKAPIFAFVSINRFSLNQQRSGKLIVSSDKVNDNSLYLTEETTFIYHNLDEGNSKTRERIRGFLGTDTNKRVYLLELGVNGSKEQFRQLIEEISAKPLSDCSLPEVVKTKATRVSNKGKVCLHHLSCETARSRWYPTVGRNSCHYETDEISTTQKFLYLEMVKSTLPNIPELAQKIKYLTSKGVKVVGISAQVKEQLLEEGFENFEDFNEYMKNLSSKLPLTEKEVNAIKKKVWVGSGEFRKITTFCEQIKDKSLQEVLEFDIKMSKLEDCEMEDKIMTFYEKDKKKIETEMEKMNKKVSGLLEKYPLVSYVQYHSYRNETGDKRDKALKELVEYINFKYSAK